MGAKPRCRSGGSLQWSWSRKGGKSTEFCKKNTEVSRSLMVWVFLGLWNVWIARMGKESCRAIVNFHVFRGKLLMNTFANSMRGPFIPDGSCCCNICLTVSSHPICQQLESWHIAGGCQGWAWLHQARGRDARDDIVDICSHSYSCVVAGMSFRAREAVEKRCASVCAPKATARICWMKLVVPSPSSLSLNRSCLALRLRKYSSNCDLAFPLMRSVFMFLFSFLQSLPSQKSRDSKWLQLMATFVSRALEAHRETPDQWVPLQLPAGLQLVAPF